MWPAPIGHEGLLPVKHECRTLPPKPPSPTIYEGTYYQTHRRTEGRPTYRQRIVDEKKIVDETVVPYMREKTIKVKCIKMRPDTDNIMLFFNNEQIEITPSNPKYQGTEPGTVKTDENGIFEGTFKIPPKTPSGTAKIYFIDKLELTQATTNYTSRGVIKKIQKIKKIISIIEEPSSRGSSSGGRSTSDVIAGCPDPSGGYTVCPGRVNMFGRTVTGVCAQNCLRPGQPGYEELRRKYLEAQHKSNSCQYNDPIAQSFLTGEDNIYLSSIDIYFKTKPKFANQPITLQIRLMENGQPTNTIVPGSTSILFPNEINVSEDGTIPTKFKFEDLVLLQPHTEYCFVLMTNSARYEVWKSTFGKTDVATDKLVYKQPYAGIMFTSSNAFTWTADQLSDIKFNINKAKFVSEGELVFKNIQPNESNGGYGIFSNLITDLVLTHSEIEYYYSTDSGNNWSKYDPEKDTQLGIVNKNLMIKCVFKSYNENISPSINKERCSILGILFNENGRYINNETELIEESNNIKVILQCANNNIDTPPNLSDGFKVYASTSMNTVERGKETWVEIPSDGTDKIYITADENRNLYYEYRFEKENLDDFKYCRFKIELETGNRAFSPRIQKLRAIVG